MSNTLQDVYHITKINSQVKQGTPEEDIKDFVASKMPRNGFITCWFHQFVLFGKISSGNLKFHLSEIPDFNKHLLLLRAFNEHEELYIWRSTKKTSRFQYRYRKDDDPRTGTSWEVFDAEQVMYGTRSRTVNDHFAEVSEDRGIRYIIPREILDNQVLSQRVRLVLHSRNYLSHDELGQVGIIDTRFVKITVKRFNNEKTG